MRGRSGLLLCLATAIVLISAIVLVQSERLEKSVEIKGSGPDVLTNPEPGELRSFELPANERQSVSSVQVSSSTELEGLSRSIGASIAVRVVDDATSAPVEGVLLTLLSERPQTESYGVAISDQNGRASFGGLAENMYLVRSMRRLPYAEGLAAVWLPSGQHEDVILRLGTGGSLTGRVVDDRGAALVGATVLASPGGTVALGWNWGSHERMALEQRDAVVTDSDGRFRLDAMASEAQGIWVIEGEVRPERFALASVVARMEGGWRNAYAYIQQGKTVDVGDIVMDRTRTWRGSVVDENGDPVPGALVSDDSNRNPALNRHLSSTERLALGLAPGQSGFTLLKGEALANRAGLFELSLRRRAVFGYVRSESGQNGRVRFPELKPGEVAEDIKLILKQKTVLSIELVDPEGRPITGGHPEVIEQKLRVGNSGYPDNRVLFQVQMLEDGSTEFEWESVSAEGSLTGLYRPDFRTDAARMGTLLVTAAGYRTERILIPSSALFTTSRVELHPQPSLQFEILPGDDWPKERWVELARHLTLVVSSLAPDGTVDKSSLSQLHRGLGSMRDFRLNEGSVRARMFVQEPGKYWGTLVPWTSRFEQNLDARASFGPFDSEQNRVHRIIVPMELLEQLLEPVPVEGGKVPPVGGLVPGEAAPEREADSFARVTVRLQNAETGEAIEHLRFTLQSDEQEVSMRHSNELTSGVYVHTKVEPGEWRATVRVLQYELWESPTFNLDPGDELDLGKIELAPFPLLRGVLLSADKSAAPAGSSVVIRSVDGKASSWGNTNADGSFEISMRTSYRVHAELNSGYSRSGSRRREQYRCTTLDDLGGEVVLAEWREVEFILDGLSESERHLNGSIELLSTACLDASHSNPFAIRVSSIGPQLDGRRIYRTTVGVGTYRPRGAAGSLEISRAPIEVVAGEGRQRFLLVPAR